MTPDETLDLIAAKAREIFEHCDAVQILVSYNEDGITHMLKTGCGNWYARQGMAHDFITTDQAQTTAKAIADTKEED